MTAQTVHQTQAVHQIESHDSFKFQSNSDVSSIHNSVKHALDSYFSQLDGTPPSDVYHMVLEQMELPLLESVMKQVDGNQTRAAQWLGLNRGTLRKKLRIYGLDK